VAEIPTNGYENSAGDKWSIDKDKQTLHFYRDERLQADFPYDPKTLIIDKVSLVRGDEKLTCNLDK